MNSYKNSDGGVLSAYTGIRVSLLEKRRIIPSWKVQVLSTHADTGILGWSDLAELITKAGRVF